MLPGVSRSFSLPPPTPPPPPSENYQFTALESLATRGVVATVRAVDADIGSNAEMDYRIVDSDGPGVFNVSTDEDTQDGVITLLKVTRGDGGTGGPRRVRGRPWGGGGGGVDGIQHKGKV